MRQTIGESMNKYLKTPQGYFTVYGWDFRHDFPLSSALPFPNSLHISITTAKTYLKKQGVKCEVVENEKQIDG